MTEPWANGSIVVSFCTTCKGRLEHLRETLPANLAANSHADGVQFVLLDYSCPDGTGEWVRSHLMPYIDSGRLVYYRVEGEEYYVASHAKNISHRVAAGAIVCNVDADNFTDSEFAPYLASILLGKQRRIARSACGGGTSGRIALLKCDFEGLGGYDEALNSGWGFEDEDLVLRAQALGLKLHPIPESTGHCMFILSSSEQRNQYSSFKEFRESDLRHRAISAEHISRGEFVSNLGKSWGHATLLKNFRQRLVV